MPETLITNGLAFLLMLLGFGFLIFIHELGHFLAAKWVGIRVEQFAVGFGQALLSWRAGMGVSVGSSQEHYLKRLRAKLKQDGANPTDTDENGVPRYSANQLAKASEALGLGSTEYRLNWIPLGGYVKMTGQDDLDPSSSQKVSDPGSYPSKSVPARLLVISAGVVMNVIFGMVFFVVAFMAGVAFPPAMVGDVAPEHPAATVYAEGHQGDEAYKGLKPGDRIVEANGKQLEEFTQLRLSVALNAPGQPVELVVDRPGQDTPLTYKPIPEEGVQGMLQIGVSPPRDARLGSKLALSESLREQGVRGGMHVTAVNGQPIDYFHEIRDIVDGSAGQPVTLSLLPAKPKRSNEQPVELTLQVVPRFAFDEQGHYDLLGLVPPTRVSAVEPGMPAQRAGIQAGDVLAKVGDQSWPTMKQLGSIIEKAAGDPVRVEVIRDGQRKVFESLQAQRRRERWLIGIRHEPSARVAVLSETLPGSTAYEQLNPPSGTRLTSVNGQSVEDWGDIQRALVAFAAEHPQGGDVDIEYRLPIPDEPVESASLSLSAADVATLQNVAWELPFPFSYSIAFNWPYTTPVVAGGPIDAAAMGVEKTWYFMVQTYLTLARLFQGSVDPDQLRGPVGIAQIGTETAKRGWPYFMFFLGLISVNLAVFNFLPLPIVDGGHAVMLIIEGVRGKPIDGRVQIGLFIAGLALLGTMVIYITFHDIMRLIN